MMWTVEGDSARHRQTRHLGLSASVIMDGLSFSSLTMCPSFPVSSQNVSLSCVLVVVYLSEVGK